MRRREELFLQGVNLELSAFSKFWRVWPCRRKMSDVDLGTHKRTWRFTKRLTLQYVNALTDFLALVKISARVLPKHRTDWTSTEGLCLAGRGRGPTRLCALTTRCAKRFENTGRYPNSTDLCAAPQYYLTELWSGRNLGKWLISVCTLLALQPFPPLPFHFTVFWGSMSLWCSQHGKCWAKCTAGDTEIALDKWYLIIRLWEMRCWGGWWCLAMVRE